MLRVQACRACPNKPVLGGRGRSPISTPLGGSFILFLLFVIYVIFFSSYFDIIVPTEITVFIYSV